MLLKVYYLVANGYFYTHNVICILSHCAFFCVEEVSKSAKLYSARVDKIHQLCYNIKCIKTRWR